MQIERSSNGTQTFAETDLKSGCSKVAEPKQLLFIGGNSLWFHELKNALSSRRPSWRVEHVSGGNVGSALSSSSRDAFIFHHDLDLPAGLLGDLPKRFPYTARIFLRPGAGRDEAEAIIGSDGYLEFDLEPVATAESVIRAVSVHDWNSHPPLKNLLARIKALPTLPRLHVQIASELRSPDGSLEMVSQYVRQDPVMAAKFLQVANSACFARVCPVSDPGEAVMVLGTEKTRALVLAGGVFSQFHDLQCLDFSPEEIWDHSLRVASLAQGITLLQTEDPLLGEAAFTAGLLHDIGKLVLAANMPGMYATAHRLQQSKRIPQVEAEMAILGTNHCELGAYLLGTWRLPLAIIEAVAWHHKPSMSNDQAFTVLTAVHAGNALAHENIAGHDDMAVPTRFDVVYLAKLGLTNRRNFWREGCGLPAKEEQDTFEDVLRRRLESGQPLR